MSVTLVGAGPGDRGLLTLKGAERVQNAEVVLYDRFVSEDILAMIPDTAEKIDVGKHAGNHPVPQEEINRLLLEKAQQGRVVVRLKGGDPFVFGRGGEELELLAENGIPFEVVPGVTSSIAGPAYAGIPVTHRDFVSSLHIITGHAKNNETPNINYDALVKLNGTLVFMMSVAAVTGICEGCIAAGMDVNMPAAVVENATSYCQRKFLGTVKTLPSIVIENNVESPAVIIIGKVCLLSDRYDWFSPGLITGRPLNGKHVIVVRGKPGVSNLANGLRELGCRVEEMSCFMIEPLTGPGSMLEKIIEKIKNYKWLVFTSSVGVDVLFDYLIEIGFDIRLLCDLKIACVGSETEKEINKRGIKIDYHPSEFNGTALAHGLTGLVKNGEKVLIPRAKDGAEDLTHILAEAGIAYDDVPIYEKIKDMEKVNEAVNKIAYNDINFVAFTSSSAVEGFAEITSNVNFGKIKAVCIGERTAATAKSYGMEVYISAEATIKSMIDTIRELCTNEY